MKSRLRAISALILTLTAIASPALAASPGTPSSSVGSMSAIVYFNADSSVLTGSAASALSTVAARVGATASVRVVGYVQVSGTSANDHSLGLARARAVAAFLASHGVHGTIRATGEGIRAGVAHSASARAAVVIWTSTPKPPAAPTPSQTDTSTATPTSTDTATVKPAPTDTTTVTVATPTTRTVVFDSQSSVPATTDSTTITPGASVTLPRVPYGPGSFGGWFSDGNNAKTRAQDPTAFVGYGTQQVPISCSAGATVHLFAHWVVDVQPAVAHGSLKVTAQYLISGYTVTVSGCASGCPVSVNNLTATSGGYQLNQSFSSSGGSITVTLTRGYWQIVFGATTESLAPTSSASSVTYTGTNGTLTRTVNADGTVTMVWTPTSGASGTDTLAVSHAS